MRIVLCFTLGFAFACGLCAYGLTVPVLHFWLLLPAIPGVFLGRRFRKLGRIALLFLGVFLGFFWFGRFSRGYLAEPAALDGQTETVVIRVSDDSYDTAYGTGVDGRVELDGKTYPIRAYLDDKVSLKPGQVVRGNFRFRMTASEGERSYYASKGIFLLAYQEDEVEIEYAADDSWRDVPAKLRFRILSILDDAFPEDTAPFAKALLLGDTRDLSYELDTSFKISGIRHVVAVSGLHVSILFAMLSAVTFHKRFLTALVSLPALFLFAAVAGFTPSVNRACMMAGLMLLAVLFEREYDGPTALAFAALVMLVYNPLVITHIGFQLSVASVSGIFLFNSPIHRWLGKKLGLEGKGRKLVRRWLCTSVSISLSAMSLTTPLCALYFGTVSLVGPLTNLLTLWLVTGIFYGLMAVCLLSLFWQTGAAGLAWLLSWPIRYIQCTAKVLSKFPLAAVYTQSPYIVCWLIFVYLLLLVFLCQHNRKPGILGCCAALGLCFALLASIIEPMLDDFRFTVLDVGQGQCLLIQNEGQTYMIDCGGSDRGTADLAAETLLSQGIYRIDGLILTHTDRDHAGAAENFLSRIPADLVVLPPFPSEIKVSEEAIYAGEPLILGTGDASFSIFPAQYPGIRYENSLCVLFESEKCDILITGDRDAFGERMLLRQADIPHVDVLMAGHHGSKYSTCDALLQAVTPDIVCISAGKDNPYGHPAPDVLERLQNYGCEVYRTDQNGTITIRR